MAQTSFACCTKPLRGCRPAFHRHPATAARGRSGETMQKSTSFRPRRAKRRKACCGRIALR